MSGKKFLTPEVWEKILTQTKSPIPPPPQKSNGQPHKGWGKGRRIWHLSRCHPSTKWLAPSSCGGFQDQSFAFRNWNYADKRNKWKEKVQKNAQIPFCGQTRAFQAFRFEIVFWGIQPCFLHGGLERGNDNLRAMRVMRAMRVIRAICASHQKFWKLEKKM